ncbi:unnamed protein product [Discula destructiva]
MLTLRKYRKSFDDTLERKTRMTNIIRIIPLATPKEAEHRYFSGRNYGQVSNMEGNQPKFMPVICAPCVNWFLQILCMWMQCRGIWYYICHTYIGRRTAKGGAFRTFSARKKPSIAAERSEMSTSERRNDNSLAKL